MYVLVRVINYWPFSILATGVSELFKYSESESSESTDGESEAESQEEIGENAYTIQ